MKRKKVKIILEKVRVEDYAAEGKSLAKLDGKVIFIEGAIPGDIVDIQLNKNKKDWAEGHAIHFHSYSPERLEPFCSHFGVCGGCQWQMLPYEKQLMYKQRQVKDNLARIGKINLPEIMPILGAEQTKFYRNKIEYTFGTKEYTREKPVKLPKTTSEPFQDIIVGKDLGNKQESKFAGPATELQPGFKGVGFHARGFFDKIVDIQTCYLQAEPSNEIRLEIKRFAVENEFSFYDIRNHTGLLRTMQIRLCRTGEIMVNIVFGENDKSRQEALLNHILQKFPLITTLLYTLNMKMNDSLHDLEPMVYSGKGFVTENMSTGHGGEEYSFKIGPKSFFQTNTTQGEQLYRVTKDFAELTGQETVYDLYCGTGSIGIFVSKQAKKVIGVEQVEAAIEDARENAIINNLNNTAFFAGDVTAVCDDPFFDRNGRPDVIITDPPRAGMSEKLIRKIIEIAAPIVVYVSCNPSTQARDLHLLDEIYEVTRIQPVDMFPHTLHIENVVQLKLKRATK